MFMCPVVCAVSSRLLDLTTSAILGIFQFVTVFSLVKYEGAKYKGEALPPWSQGVGWMMALSSMLCVPVYAIYIWIVTKGPARQVCAYSSLPEHHLTCNIACFQKLRDLVRPEFNVRAFREGGTEDHFGAEERRLSQQHGAYQHAQQHPYSKSDVAT